MILRDAEKTVGKMLDKQSEAVSEAAKGMYLYL